MFNRDRVFRLEGTRQVHHHPSVVDMERVARGGKGRSRAENADGADM